MSFAYMITVLAISGLVSEVTSARDCIEGFMDYDLLEQKASQIDSPDGVGALSSNTLSSNTSYVIPELKFTCSGTISGFLLGIDVRIDSNRDMYPTLSLYHSPSNNDYVRVPNSTRTIDLGASNFSVSGVYEYNLSDHLQFSDGDVLGIYQPPLDKSVVQLYYRHEVGYRFNIVSKDDEVTIDNSNNKREQDRGVLLHPITSEQSCIAAFISADEIRMEAKNITTVDDEYSNMERLYKDIKFTCDGYITHVIIGTKNLSSIFNPPEIRLWRRNDTGYERSGQSIPLSYDAAVQDVSTPFLRWYNLSSPVPVQKDDILGIYNYLPIDDADCLIYYQKYNGPINYITNLSQTGDNHYPLVSVIFGTGETVPVPSVPVTSSLTMQTTMRSLGSSDGTFSQTTSPSLTIIEGKNSGSSIGVVVGSIISVLLVLVTVAGLIIAVFTFLWRRKYKKFKDASLPNRNDFSSAGLTNMVYSGLPINGGEPGFKADVGLNNPVYEADGTRESEPAEYESALSTMKSCTGHYEIADSVKTTEALTLPYPEYESCNADLSPPLPEEHSSFATLESKYFTEEPIYWEPESNTESIYQQLSGKGFREIPRETISVSEEIGSGQFGTVHKGIWNTTKGSKEAAIKTLKMSATENEEVKFLQEAAINGQFHHRNVVKLFGVVTVGHPIMIVLEFATNGDLREFLVNMRPVPGELPDDSFLTVLSDFSYHVASGMKYLSKKKFVHRDLAARNVLVGDGKICKIADFGMSIDLQDETYYMSHGSMIPLKWTAPEAINFRKYSTQSDVWSFGSVLYEIWSVGHRPFEQHTNQEYISLIESGHRLCPPPGCPEVIYKMMIQSWHPDASSRPTFDELQSMLEDSESFTSETNLKAYTGSVNTYSDVQKIY